MNDRRADHGPLAIVSPLGRDGARHGGIVSSLLNLAASLTSRGIVVDLISFYPRAAHQLRHSIPPGTSLVLLPGGSHRRARAQLVGYLRQRRPARVLAGGHRFNVLALKAREKISESQVYVGVRNNVSRETAGMSRLRRRRWLGEVRRLYPRASGIIAVSRGVADDFARVAKLPLSRVSHAYNPIVTDELLSRMNAPVSHPWLTSPGPPVIVAAGRLEPQKDYPTLLHAFALLRAGRDCRLLILGEGSRRRELETLCRELDLEPFVSMPGHIDNPTAAIRHAAVYALTSRFEGLPGALIQALATGTPIVATDCESGPREILANGQYGRLVPVGDVGAVAGALAQALDAPRAPPPPKAIKPFRPMACANRYLELMGLGRA